MSVFDFLLKRIFHLYINRFTGVIAKCNHAIPCHKRIIYIVVGNDCANDCNLVNWLKGEVDFFWKCNVQEAIYRDDDHDPW